MAVPNYGFPPSIPDMQVDALVGVLERSRAVGFLGDGPIGDQITHALGFLTALDVMEAAPDRFLDLGSGGGVPGLVLAVAWPTTRATLLDAQQKRCQVLQDAVDRLEIGDRVRVARGRAEELGRDPDLRGGFDVVVARSFGPPAVVAECASPFLRVGGLLAVSEPPEDTDRWPAAGLAELGLERRDTAGHRDGPRIQVLHQASELHDRYPRRVGIPAKRPLF